MNSVLLWESFITFSENENKLSPSTTKVRGIVPGKIFEFCIAVGEFCFIFGERKQTFSHLKRGPGFCLRENSWMLYCCRRVLPIFGERNKLSTSKTEVRGIVPGKIFEFCLAVGEFWYIFVEQKQSLIFTLKRKSEKSFEFCIAVGEFQYIFGERKQTVLSPKTMVRQGRHFNFFLRGPIFYIIFQCHWTIEKLKKQHFICSNLTLFIVPFFLFFSFVSFSFFFFSFFFSFSLGRGDGPQPPHITPLWSGVLSLWKFLNSKLLT